jgi:hypothetical protein
LVFKKSANVFARKLGKIAENCDHNIDPSLEFLSMLEHTFSRCRRIADEATQNVERRAVVRHKSRSALAQKISTIVFNL